MQQPINRNTEKCPTQLLTTLAISSWRNAPLHDVVGPGLVLRSSWGAFVCGQLASVVSLAYVSILKGLNVPLGLLRACAANRLGRHSLIHERVSSSRAIMGGRSGLSH